MEGIIELKGVIELKGLIELKGPIEVKGLIVYAIPSPAYPGSDDPSLIEPIILH